MKQTIDELSINTIRTLSMDAVQKANSGHPGTPMAMAPVVYTLWQRFLRFDPEDPIWPNRDRFVLSPGHASMLLYSMLHLCGVKAVNPAYEQLGELTITLEDIKRFRQLDSKCPGHPEYRWTSGVETTTGPLGQGVATSVGMAIAGQWMAQHFNRPGFEMFGYDVYALCGDGDMMEGVSGEAAAEEMADYLAALPAGSVVLGAIADEGTLHLTPHARAALRTILRSQFIDTLRYQDSWAIVARVGATLPIAENQAADRQVVLERVLTFPMP